MPKNSSQTRSDIVSELLKYGSQTFSQEQLHIAMNNAGISAGASIRQYTRQLVSLHYIERASGGYQLSKESRTTSIITIRVRPTQNVGAITKTISDAIARYGKTTTIEVEI